MGAGQHDGASAGQFGPQISHLWEGKLRFFCFSTSEHPTPCPLARDEGRSAVLWCIVADWMWVTGPKGVALARQATPNNPSNLLHFIQFCMRTQVRHPPYGPMDHVPPHVWTIKAAQPPHKIRERMRERCVLCVFKSAPPSHFVVSARSIIVLNVLTPTLVGILLFVRHMRSDIH